MHHLQAVGPVRCVHDRRRLAGRYLPGRALRGASAGGASKLMDETYRISIGPQLAGKIQPGSPYWREFNGAFVNRELHQPELITAICQGHAFTTWHTNNWRASDNYQVGQHLGVDFDTEDRRSSIEYLMKDPFVGRYAAAVYTTPSHTIDKPRARVLFLLDTPIHQPANYVLAVSSLLWLFGTADRKCKDPCRFFYAMAPGGQIEWPANVLPLAIVRDMIARYQATGRREKRTITEYAARDVDEQQVQDALKHIPPWQIEYDEWLAVLMAIHSAFPGTNGLAMADAWGQGAQGEIERKWRSFKPTGNVSGQVGLGTLFALAKEHGYMRNRVAA